MIKVIKEVRMDGVTAYYKLENQSGEQCDVMPDQLENFCILREFENARYDGGKLLPNGAGFEICNELTPVELRRRKLRNFVRSLRETSIAVTAAKWELKEDPQSFQLEAMGYVGKISIRPGTEFFNKNMLEVLHFTNVELAPRRYIDPSYGYTERYIGWKMLRQNEVGHIKLDYYFRIEPHLYSYAPHWVKFVKESGARYGESDISHYVYVRGDVNGCAVIGRNGETLEMVLFKNSI